MRAVREKHEAWRGMRMPDPDVTRVFCFQFSFHSCDATSPMLNIDVVDESGDLSLSRKLDARAQLDWIVLDYGDEEDDSRADRKVSCDSIAKLRRRCK